MWHAPELRHWLPAERRLRLRGLLEVEVSGELVRPVGRWLRSLLELYMAREL